VKLKRFRELKYMLKASLPELKDLGHVRAYLFEEFGPFSCRYLQGRSRLRIPPPNKESLVIERMWRLVFDSKICPKLTSALSHLTLLSQISLVGDGEGRVSAMHLGRTLTLIRWSQMGSLSHASLRFLLCNRFVQ
jgi:hypothetical protein